MATPALLEVANLAVEYRTQRGVVRAVGGVDFTLAEREFLGVVGESGSGKSQLLLALLGLSAPGAIVHGSIRYRGTELVGAGDAKLNRLRGNRISMVFQDPMTALNPYLTIGQQLVEVLRLHQRMGRAEAQRRAAAILEAVHISEAERRLKQYPHELSGGMRQRAMIAMALVCEPEILLADEPTTALDVTVQAQILTLLRELRERMGTAVILVTHDLGIVAELADRVAVMYAGRCVEAAEVHTLFNASLHPYTRALKFSLPRLDSPLPERMFTIPGNPPNPARLPAGCSFAPRCSYVHDRCLVSPPALISVAPGHSKACYLTSLPAVENPA